MFENFERGKARIGEIDVNYATAGRGPALLLLHGFPQNLAMWARVAPLLADRYTVICADLRGYGDSSKPTAQADLSNYSFRAMAADQVELMRRLGHARFHVVGHDRGGRTAHRMALDHSDCVLSLAVLDIVPTYAMFMDTNRHRAKAYWHWYFLSQPAPFPEHMIGKDPDYFFETCLVGWGATRLQEFDAQMLADYRRCWRDPAMIHGSCSDYRAGSTIDLEHDAADIDVKVSCPTLALWGSSGLMHQLFDIEQEWRKRCAKVQAAMLPGGHFFIDMLPRETAEILSEFLSSAQSSTEGAKARTAQSHPKR
jgi:haloacetate dehalogenase